MSKHQASTDPVTTSSDPPLLTIIIPSYNQGRFIRQTIESCLSQNYRPIEILVIDGASTDGTLDVLHDYDAVPEVTWSSEPDDGPVSAVNKGLTLARGELCGIQSSDDFYLPGAFAAAAECFLDDSRVILAFADTQRVDVDGNLLDAVSQPAYSIERLLSRAVYIPQSSAFFRRAKALELGGWNARTPYVPDTRLWLELALRGPVTKAWGFWGATRHHPEQRDHASSRIYNDYLQMLAELEELRALPIRQRRAAQAGARLLRLRYGGPWSDMQLTLALWFALLLYPPCWQNPGFPHHRLVPGYFRFAALAGRARRAIRRTRADTIHRGCEP